jgi:hypothetical protein
LQKNSFSFLFSSNVLIPYVWDEQFANNGLNGDAYALAINGNDIYVGGYFVTANGDTVNHIAKWNGTVHPGVRLEMESTAK